MKVFVVIPALNEVQVIFSVVAKLRPYADRVVVVDDGSSDATAGEAERGGATVLRHVINRGYGAALTTGMEYSLKHGAEAVVHFDADGQFVASEIPRLVDNLVQGKPSVVLGSRFLGKTIGMSKLKRLTLKTAIIFTWLVSKIKLTDAHNGFRAFTAEALQLMRFQQNRMAFSSEIVHELYRTRIPFVEVPVTVTYTKYSVSGSAQGHLPALKIVWDMLLGRLIR